MSALTDRIQAVKDDILLMGHAAEQAQRRGDEANAMQIRHQEVVLTGQLWELFIEQQRTEPLKIEDNPVIMAYLAREGITRA